MAFTRRGFLMSAPLAAITGAAITGAAITGAAIAGSALYTRSAWAADSLAGHVSRLTGAVAILRSGAETAASVGGEIFVADTIRTGTDGKAEIAFTDGSVLTVGPDSEVAVSFFAPEASESTALLDLISGIARMTVNKATAWGRFEVRTTTAVASVRGTEYLVEALPEKTAVFVAEGRVAVSSRAGAGTIILRKGQGVDVTKEYVELVAKTWGAKRRDAALARVTFP